MKILRTCLTIFALFVLVGVVAAACLIMFIDPNKLKPAIIQKVNQITGYQLAIEDDLAWSFYPRIGVKIKHMGFSQINHSKPFLEMNNVQIATKLSDLIQAKLKNNKLIGKIYVDSISLNNINAKKIKADLNWENNILTLQILEASLCQGTLEGVVYGSQLTRLPSWNWVIKLHHIEIKSLLQNMNGSNTKLMLSGLGEAKFVGSTQGKIKEEMLENLSGSLEVQLTRGIIEGININYMIQTVDALLTHKTVNISLTDTGVLLGQTPFDEFSSNIIIEKGIAKTEDLVLKAPTFLANAKGVISLIEKTIDFELAIKAQPNVVTSEQLKTFVIPVLIKGTFNEPGVRLNMEAIRQLVVKEQMQQVKNKTKEIIKEHLPEKAQEFLQNLLGK